jgi:putative membrane protein
VDSEPDTRFLLANERTLLAWLRTSVALQAGGVGILHFAPTLDLSNTIGLGLVLLGALAGLSGYWRYRSADRAIRRGEVPPHGLGPEAIALAVTLLALLLLAVVFRDELG